MSFPSEKVREFRRQLDLDQDEFARMLSVSKASVVRWEKLNSPEKIGGTAGYVLSGFHYGYIKYGAKFKEFIKESLAFGGLAYIMVTIMNSLFNGKQQDSPSDSPSNNKLRDVPLSTLRKHLEEIKRDGSSVGRATD